MDNIVSMIILSKLGYFKQYITNDYLLSGKNLKEDLLLFVQNHPEIDINVITPKTEYIEKFLEWYQ